MQELGFNALWGSLYVFLPATLASIDRMLLDGPLCAAFAGFAYYASSRKLSRWIWLLLSCAPLIKETGMIMAASYGLVEMRARRWRNVALAAATQLPAVAWFIFVHVRTPASEAHSIVTFPLLGHLNRFASSDRV